MGLNTSESCQTLARYIFTSRNELLSEPLIITVKCLWLRTLESGTHGVATRGWMAVVYA